MVNWTDVNSMQKKKLNLQIELDKLLNSPDKTVDKVNALRAEILYLDKQITKILGSNELKRQAEIRKRKLGQEESNIRAYFAFKAKYKQICCLGVSVSRMLSLDESSQINRGAPSLVKVA